MLEVIPDPVSLIEAMRAVGYSAEAAIADLIDNSISAQASSIKIEYDASDTPYVSVLDDGHGMTPAELTNAMRHGSRNPTELRAKNDLGRFGLGMKTASLSQCRQFTVVSKKDGVISARCWDLDVVQQEGKWVVVVPPEEDLCILPQFANLKAQSTGTLVIWQELDRLVAGAENPQSEMTIRLEPLREHLALVFHRFTQREDGATQVEIAINGLPIPSRDPFIKSNTYRQQLEGQLIKHERGDVQVTPYILPPVNKFSQEEIELSGGKKGLRGTQGFYIYRNRRLVIWGTWFKLVPKEEFYKLARIQVDIPNSFDDLWALDIKKSAAFPPEIIRQRLKELIPHFANTCKRTIAYPGRRNIKVDFTPLWLRIEPEHGKFRYEINFEHSLIQFFSSQIDSSTFKTLATLLKIISDSLPIDSIYADMCEDFKTSDTCDTLEQLIIKANAIRNITALTAEQIIEIDPIVRYPQFHSDIVRKLNHES